MEDHMIKHDQNEGLLHGWHLDKRVSVSHMFATLAFAFGLASWQWAEHERLTVLAEQFDAQKILSDLNLTSHKEVDEAKDEAFILMMDNIQERDRETLLLINKNYAEILQRLSSIDAALNRHLENTAAR